MIKTLLSLLLLPFVALANDSCPEKKVFPNIDLRKDFGPIRNQGQAGWCYAYAASDAANYVLKKKYGIDTSKKSNQLSAAAMALDQFSPQEIQVTNLLAEVNTNPSKTKFTSLLKEKEEALIKAAADADKNDPEYSKNLNRTFASMQRFLDRLNDKNPAKQNALDMIKNRDYSKVLRSFGTLQFSNDDNVAKASYEYSVAKQLAADRSPELQPKVIDNATYGGKTKVNLTRILKDGYCTEDEIPTLKNDLSHQSVLQIMQFDASTPQSTYCEAESAAKTLFPKASLTGIRITLDNAARNEASTLSRLVEKSCSRKKFPTPQPSLKEVKWDSKTVKDQLSKENPIVLQVSSKVFRQDQESILDPVTKVRPSDHVVTIVGQRFNCETKQPEYIVRNSWGETSCENNVQLIHPTNKKRQQTTYCDKGDYVIPEAALEKSTEVMTFMDFDN